jgi:stage II sporulation protein AA (anti-sigma F factor antagonist)
MACAVKNTDGWMPCFEVILSTDTTRSCAQLRGELDLSTAPRLERLLDELYRDGYRQITLDMSGLEFLGASALSVFVRFDRALRAAGGELVLARPSRMASRILSITGLDATLTIQ